MFQRNSRSSSGTEKLYKINIKYIKIALTEFVVPDDDLLLGRNMLH